MADFDWSKALTGVQILLTLLLILVAILHLFKRNTRSTIFAFTCFSISFWFVFSSVVKIKVTNWFMYAVGHNVFYIFAPSLVYLYVFGLKNKITNKKLFYNTILPLLIAIAIPLLAVTSRNSGYIRNLILIPSLIGLCLYYFIETKKELKNLKFSLIPMAYKKYKIFSYSVTLSFLYMGVVSLISYFFIKEYLLVNYGIEGKINENTGSMLIDILAKFFNGPFVYSYVFLMTIIHVLFFLIFLFGLSELNYFKKVFLPKQIIYSENASSDVMKEKITSYFKDLSKITNQNLDVSQCAIDLNCNKKDITDYLKKYNLGTFNKYLNSHRIHYFKETLAKEDNSKYDIFGVAQICGFKSKATFYRSFKEIEGITPKQYIKNIN